MSQHKKKKSSLEDEINILRENTDVHRIRIEESYKCLKSEMIHQNQENSELIKNLTIKNKILQKNINELKKQAEYYKLQYTKLSQRARASQDINIELKRSRSKPKIFHSKMNSNIRNSTPSLKMYDYSSYRSVSSVSDEDEMNKKIKNVETEVSKLGEKYKKMQDIELDTSEIDVYRRNLEDICVNMEKKNSELFELKKRQQECLKLRLIS